MSTRIAAQLQSRRLICWGELLWDLYPDGKRLGGAPANVAYHLAALGAQVALITRVGNDDLGREAVAGLAAAGVDTSLIQVDPERPTGRVEVEIHDGEASYRLVPGCAWERIELTGEGERALAGAAVFCFGSLSQRLERGPCERAISSLAADCMTVCDPNLRPRYVDFGLIRTLLSAARVVKINDHEAEILARHAGRDSAEAWLMQELGVELVALTRGPQGSVLIRGHERVEHPGVAKAPGVDGDGDNVGAGDAFNAALVRLLDLGRGLDEINHAANQYASYVASQRGATPVIPRPLRDHILAGPGRQDRDAGERAQDGKPAQDSERA